MSNDVEFTVRLAANGLDRVVHARWPDGFEETLIGLFATEETAKSWIQTRAAEYVEQRRKDGLQT